MGEYTAYTWVEKVTQVGPTRMNVIEAGIRDATLLKRNASGLTFTDSRPAQRSVQWTRLTDGAVAAEITATNENTALVPDNDTRIYIATKALGSSGYAQTDLQARDASNAIAALLRCFSSPGALAGNRKGVQVGNGIDTLTLLDDNSRSDFLQLAVRASRNIDFGAHTFTFSASANSAEDAITHNLGVVPSVILGVAEAAVGGTTPMVFRPLATTYTTTQFKAKMQATATLSASFTGYWIAIG